MWVAGLAEIALTELHPKLASWERSDHPQQVRLRAYLADVVARCQPLPDGPLSLELSVDVEHEGRLSTHYDLENYLTPLFGRHALPPERFVLVRSEKHIGGGSTLSIGKASPAGSPVAPMFTRMLTGSTARAAWKEQLRSALEESGVEELPEGFVRVAICWKCSPKRNWTGLWKPTGDAMGPVLGYVNPANPYHPRDDRITELEFQVVTDEGMGWDVEVGMSWGMAG